MAIVLNLLKLARLTATQQIVDPATGSPTPAFQRLQNDRASNEETIVNSIIKALTDAGLATSAATDAAGVANAAKSAAQTANGTANTAIATAASVARQQAIISSYVSPGILSASANATSATINVAPHTRYYADGSSVSVNAGTIAGQPLSSTLYVYYVDPARSGGAVSYQATTSLPAAAQGGDRHAVGTIVTPGANLSTTGRTAPAPGLPV